VNCADNFMNLATVIDASRQEFADREYEKTKKADIIMHFLRDELGITSDKFQEFLLSGSTMVNGSPIEGTDMGRFFLWYYINYIVFDIAEEC